MELSKRLQAVADLLSEGLRVADIGCDHGFLSIYLVETGKSPHCIAMDVNQGPLDRAKEHIDRQRLSTYIETRLSNGALGLKFTGSEGRERQLEADAAVLSGMGGRLMMRIIEDSPDKFMAMKEFILQPQSEVSQVRRFLRKKGFRITAEDMVFEEGKFYPVMKAERKESGCNTEEKAGGICPKGLSEDEGVQKGDDLTVKQELYDWFGEYLLTEKHPVLRSFLEKEESLYEGISEELKRQNTLKAADRQREVEEKLRKIRQGLDWFKDEM